MNATLWKTSINLHIKYQLFLSDLNDCFIFATHFRKIFKYQISWQSVHWEPNFSMRTDGQTDRNDIANSCFSQFCESALKLDINVYETGQARPGTRFGWTGTKRVQNRQKEDLKTKPDPVRRCTLEHDEEIIRPFYMLKIFK